MDKDTPISLDSKNYKPIFSLLLADNYGNAMKEFNASEQSKFSLKLTGDIFTESDPIAMEQDSEPLGNQLLFDVDEKDYNRYKNALMLPNPYRLRLTYDDQTLDF
jgi:hypothetical protein